MLLMYPPLVLIAHKSVNKAETSLMYHFFSILWCKCSRCPHGVGSTKRNKHKVRFSLCEKQREMLVSICCIIREEVNAATDKTTTPV